MSIFVNETASRSSAEQRSLGISTGHFRQKNATLNSFEDLRQLRDGKPARREIIRTTGLTNRSGV